MQAIGKATLVLFDSSLVTLLRLFLGVGLGILLGVGIGLLLGISSLVREISLPPILLLRTIPIMALIPLFLFPILLVLVPVPLHA